MDIPWKHDIHADHIYGTNVQTVSTCQRRLCQVRVPYSWHWTLTRVSKVTKLRKTSVNFAAFGALQSWGWDARNGCTTRNLCGAWQLTNVLEERVFLVEQRSSPKPPSTLLIIHLGCMLGLAATEKTETEKSYVDIGKEQGPAADRICGLVCRARITLVYKLLSNHFFGSP